MQFSILLTSVLATVAIASPAISPSSTFKPSSSPLPSPSPTGSPGNGTCDPIDAHKGDIIFASGQLGCSISSCWAVIKEAGCIGAAILAGDPPAVLACLGQAGWKELCDCADCVPGLSGFLQKHGLCPATPPAMA